jgi:hypothetical protein
VEAGAADCVGLSFAGWHVKSEGERANRDGNSSTVSKDSYGNEHMMIEFNVSSWPCCCCSVVIGS